LVIFENAESIVVTRMKRKQLVRDLKMEGLARMEDAARTEEDFKVVVKQWNHLDKNAERRKRDHEIGRASEEMLHWDRVGENDEKGRMKEGLDTVIGRPLEHPWWRQQIRGDFIDIIYDNAGDMWQLIEDQDISDPVKSLTNKQKQVLFFSAVRLCSSAQIGCYQDKTDRAVRKLLAAALGSIREKLAALIREQLETECPHMTLAKREFLLWHDNQKAALDSGKGE